jgi:hypothetical protein
LIGDDGRNFFVAEFAGEDRNQHWKGEQGAAAGHGIDRSGYKGRTAD